jgi:CRP/FNR family transcriptional regulator, anaerobic regulatory protein
MEGIYTPLLKHIAKFADLTREEETTLLGYLTFEKIKKKGLLLKEGQVCDARYFILSGCCCLYMVHETGNEQVIQFGIENWWITDYVSLESGKPSRFNIRALEECVVVLLDKRIEEDLFARVPKLERYFRVILQRAYSATIQRIQFIFTMSGEERYLHFSTAFPDFVQRVPQYVLASYLGFKPEFLSKIRARKNHI